MGRWRPPPPDSSPYITAEGYRLLEDELKNLWQRRADVTRALTAAAAEGDRSENAEYIYRKKELREIDQRIGYLQQRLPVLHVISDPPADKARVFFGARVTVEDAAGTQTAYRIVGADELDPGKHCISIDSPLARAMLKKTLHDAVEVATPAGRVRYRIRLIRYTD